MATQASAFPRLSPSGRRVLAGEKVIVVDRTIDVGPGTSAQWGDEEQVIFTRQPDGAFMEWHPGAVPTVIRDGFNAFSVGGRNRWAGYSAARGVVEFDNGTVVSGWSGPALSDDPSVWAAVIHERGEIVTSHGRPQRFADRDCRDLRWCGRALVWNVYVLGRWQIAGCREIGGMVDLLNVEPEEFWPVPLLVNGALWLMTHSHNRLLLRPWGSREGYIVANGITNTPDAKQMPNGRVRVVWDAGHNVLEDISLDPNTRPMVSLEPPVAIEPVEDTSGDVIDLWPYILPEPGMWPRTARGPDGHDMNCKFDGRNFWLLPFGQPDHWVRWVIDGDTFTLREDRSRDGQSTGDYSFTKGLWLRRRMKPGDTINNPDNVLVRYEPDSCRIVDIHDHPFRSSLLKHYTTFDCGPDLGVRAVIVTKYDPGTTWDTYELAYWAKGAGNFRFEAYDQKTDRLRFVSRFNDFGGPDVQPTPGCWKPEHLALTPVNQQGSMTIIEPTAYPATASANRLRVVCGPEPGSHWSSWVEWIYRRVGESGWTQQGERRNPQDDADHTFTFPSAGEYEIGLRWASGQTGRQRIVRVEGAVVQPPPPPPPSTSQTMQIQTNDRQHYITVSSNGLGTATETSADHATVQLTLVRGDDGRFALRGPNGKIGSAQPDGTFTFDRDKGDDWRPDGWEALRAERSPLGGESYVTDHGTRLRAVNQGGSKLQHDQRDVPDIDETFWPSVPLVGSGHVGGGVVGVPGALRVAGRWFASPAGLFDYREVSAFALYSLWLQKRVGEIDAFLSAMRPYATAARVVLTLDGDFWTGRGYRCAPDMPGFYEELRPFAAHCESRGFYVRFCLVGAIEPFGGHWFPDRRDVWTEDLDARVRAYIERVIPAIADAPNVLTEDANEPGQIGLRSSFDRVKGWGRLVKRLAPHQLHNFAAVDGPNDGDTSFVDAPADFVDTHIHRMKEYHGGDGWNGWLWVKRSSEHAVLDNEHMPAISGEPINFGSSGVGGSGDAERSPAIAMAYAATSRLRRYLTNIHFDDGLWCLPPNAETVACLEGWKRGLDAIPMDFGGGWCNGHHSCSPWEDSNFPSSDEVRDHRGPVRIFGRGGPGNYIGASIREVVGHRPRARRPVEEIARLEWGGYACAVYRA